MATLRPLSRPVCRRVGFTLPKVFPGFRASPGGTVAGVPDHPPTPTTTTQQE